MADVRFEARFACDGCGREVVYRESVPFGSERRPFVGIDSSWAQISGWPWHYVFCDACRRQIEPIMEALPALARGAPCP